MFAVDVLNSGTYRAYVNDVKINSNKFGYFVFDIKFDIFDNVGTLGTFDYTLPIKDIKENEEIIKDILLNLEFDGNNFVSITNKTPYKIKYGQTKKGSPGIISFYRDIKIPEGKYIVKLVNAIYRQRDSLKSPYVLNLFFKIVEGKYRPCIIFANIPLNDYEDSRLTALNSTKWEDPKQIVKKNKNKLFIADFVTNKFSYVKYLEPYNRVTLPCHINKSTEN